MCQWPLKNRHLGGGVDITLLQGRVKNNSENIFTYIRTSSNLNPHPPFPIVQPGGGSPLKPF